MNTEKSRIYIGWTVVIGFIFTLMFKIEKTFIEQASKDFTLHQTYIYISLFPIFLGILLRLPKFIKDIRYKRNWSIDWLKLIVIGLPTLYISQINIIYFFIPNGHLLPFTTRLSHYSSTSFFEITGLIFGYILLDSINFTKNYNKQLKANQKGTSY